MMIIYEHRVKLEESHFRSELLQLVGASRS